MQHCIVIDDIEYCLAHLDIKIQELICKDFLDARDVIRSYCISRNWPIFDYSCYLEWLTSKLSALHDTYTYNLDKLLLTNNLIDASIITNRLVCTRTEQISYFNLFQKPNCNKQTSFSKQVVLIDDAVYTGNTLKHTLSYLSKFNIKIDMGYIGFVSDKYLKKKILPLPILYYKRIPSDVDILHLRDFIPWTPWSGKPVKQHTKNSFHSIRLFAINKNGSKSLYIDKTEKILIQYIIDFSHKIGKIIDEAPVEVKNILTKKSSYTLSTPLIQDDTGLKILG